MPPWVHISIPERHCRHANPIAGQNKPYEPEPTRGFPRYT
jgi:hypothetical protein